MSEEQKSIPTWVLIVSGIFALLEILFIVSILIAPQSVLETVDLTAKGVYYVVYMWAARQFALGFIFAFATLKRSVPMLTLAYVFFLVMFAGDLIIGIWQKENSMIISAVVMGAISSVMIFVLNRRK